MVAREAVQKGLDSPNTGQDFFFDTLTAYVVAPKVLGLAAIDIGRTEFMYRCLDALGWLGCSALQSNNVTIGIECLQGLIQLGRKARAEKLACFWDSCGLSPYDHALEWGAAGHEEKNVPQRSARRAPKTILRLPDLDHAKAAVLNSLTCPDAQRGYRHTIDEFVDWYCSEPRLAFNKTVVLRYRLHLESRKLAPGTINLRLGAVRRLADEASDCGLLSPDLAAGIRRVKGVKKLGVRLGNWLTAQQSQALWRAPDAERLKGKRDRALLAVLASVWGTTTRSSRVDV